jgi:hypothetical protein
MSCRFARIVQTLKAEGVPSFTGKEEWASCSIGFILTDRRALGEYQPCKTGRVPDGPVIPNYYPAAVSEQEYLAARAGMTQRRRNTSISGQQWPWTKKEDEFVRELSVGVAARRTGRSRAAVYQRRHALGLTEKQHRAEGGNFVNVFNGLVRNARPPHDSYVVVSRMDASGPSKALLNSAHAEGKAPCWLFQLAPFEKGVLGALRELDPCEVLPPKDSGPSEVSQLQAALAGVEAELADAAAFMAAHGFSHTIGQRVAALEGHKVDLEKKLLDARAKASCPAEVAWQEYGGLLDALERAPDRRDARLRLRTALRRIVSEIWLLVVPRGADRLAAVQIDFAGGGRRSYVIWYQPKKNNGRATVPGFWCVRSWTLAEYRAASVPEQPDLAIPQGRDCDTDAGGAAHWLPGWQDMEGFLQALDKDDLDRLVFGRCARQPLP